MKRLMTLILLIPLFGIAQPKNPIDKLFDKYANKDGFTTVNISGKMLEMASDMKESKREKLEKLGKISGIRILSVEDKKMNKNLNFYKELESDGFFKDNNYEVLMEITEKNQVVRFLGRSGEEGKLSHLLLVVGGDDNTLISISGIIDPKDIGNIGKSLNVNPSKQ